MMLQRQNINFSTCLEYIYDSKIVVACFVSFEIDSFLLHFNTKPKIYINIFVATVVT